MQDHTISCDEAQRLIVRYLQGEPCPELTAHLARCEACLDACTDAALRIPAEVRVPRHFREHVLARTLAATPAARWQAAEYPMVLLAAVLFPLVGAALWLSGALQGLATPLFQALARPEVLAAAGGMETALLLLWLWRMVSAEA